jgi:acyl-CoA dehydrogenase
MNDVIEALSAAVADACTRHGQADSGSGWADGGWDPQLWDALEQIGVTTISVPENWGGAGGDVRTAVAVLQELGRHSARVPLAETALLAGWLLAGCARPVPTGPLTAAVASADVALRRVPAGWSIAGILPRVPWARHARAVVVLLDNRVIELLPDEMSLEHGSNMAGEPRDTLVLSGVTVPTTRVHDLPTGSPVSAAAFEHRAALARTALMAGAAHRVLDLSVAHAGQREQFGRPIAKFQAVQQSLAALAGETLLCKVVSEAAALAVDSGEGADVAVSAAKVAAGHAVGVVCSVGHQVHGAIGFTEEHSLHRSTTRLWAWRDECGNDDVWAARLGALVLDAGANGLWRLLTETQ